MKFNELNKTNMDVFGLKWRWTDQAYCLMPDRDLKRILPLDDLSAKAVFKKSIEFPNGDLGSPNMDKYSKDVQFLNTEKNNVISWLEERLSICEIVVSWHQDNTVLTDTEIFVKYWDDFCYPSSDDVTIWSEDELWVLQYRHYELFWCGKAGSV
jgi:hypothetical protein